MNLLRLSPEVAYYRVPLIGYPGDAVRVPMRPRDYQALALPGALDVASQFRQQYPRGLRRLPLDRMGPAEAVLTERQHFLPMWLWNERGAITAGNFDSHFEGNSSITRSVTLVASAGATDCGFGAGATDRAGAGTTITSLVFNGVAFTLAAAQSGPGSQQIRTGYLVAPTAGAANLVLTASSASTILAMSWIVYTGVDQTTPIDAATIAGVSGTGNNVASWVLSGVAAGNIALGFCAHLASGITTTPSGNTVMRNTENTSNGNWGGINVGDDTDATIAWATNGVPPSYGQAFEVNASGAAAVVVAEPVPGGSYDNRIYRPRLRVY